MRKILLYSILSGVYLGMQAQEKENLVVYEDRVWEYNCRTTGTFRSRTIRAKFEGTEIIEGKEYARFCILSSVEWQPWDSEIVEYRDYSSESIWNRTLGYVREKDGKVYTYCDRDMPEGEYLIFDVDSPGVPVECVLRWKISRRMMPGEMTLSEGESLTNSGRVWECYRVERACMVEYFGDTVDYLEFADPGELMFVRGVGPSAMPHGGGGTVLGFEPLHFDTGGGNGYSLNNVYDLEGNIIFEGSNDEIPSVGVSAPVADCDDIKIVYDLTGREVSRGENATDGLTPGIYVVRKGNRSSKIVI
ncbi:MAG: T9SS type A sorting domain-containing protein [Muribaculaceae bacterium]|nr:T9SS type A sorting domain-containing protein [Muribaculaceae bacterium]